MDNCRCHLYTTPGNAVPATPPSAPHCAFFIFTTWGFQSFLSASNSPFVFLHSTWTLFTGTLLIKVMPPTHHQVAPYRRRLGGFLLPNTPSSVLTPYFFLVRSLDFYPILFQAKTKGDSKNHAQTQQHVLGLRPPLPRT